MNIRWRHYDRPELLIKHNGNTLRFRQHKNLWYRASLCCGSLGNNFSIDRCPGCGSIVKDLHEEEIYSTVTALAASLTSPLPTLTLVAYGALLETQVQELEAKGLLEANMKQGHIVLSKFNRELYEFTGLVSTHA